MTTSRETQTSFEDHPDHGPMMKAAGAVEQIRKGSELIRRTYENLAISVEIARDNGATWQQIGDALGVTRSAAQQYYGH